MQPHEQDPTETDMRWVVIAVTDPGTGGFGYTVGLNDLGHPELHMWLRPTDGFDPGADFALSRNDVGLLLNQFAEQLIDGTLDVGTTVTQEFDHGAAFGRFTVGAPVDPESVDAFQVRRGASVLPLRWDLVRPAAAAPKPADEGRWAEVERHSERVWDSGETVIEWLEVLLPFLDRELADEELLHRSFARTSGQDSAYERCRTLAAADLRALSSTLDDVTELPARSPYRHVLESMIYRALTCVYASQLLYDATDHPPAPRSRNLVNGLIDEHAADRRFWTLPGTDPIRRAAAASTTEQLEQLAEPIDRDHHPEAREEFLRAYWHASGLVLTEGGGKPLPSETLPERPGMTDDALEWATDAVAAAAMAAAVKVDGDPLRQELSDVMLAPWNAVVG